MDDKTFNGLSQKELFDGFLSCRKSAEDHRACARLMAEKEVYGLANSHLILGAEEAIKAIIILFKYTGSDLGLVSVKPFFSSHKAKHDQGLKMMLDVIKVRGLPDILIFLNKAVKVIRKKVTPLEALQNLRPLIRPLDKMDEWWRDANERKNDGFYVGHYQGRWQKPTMITKAGYEESEMHTTHIFELLDLSWPLNANYVDSIT